MDAEFEGSLLFSKVPLLIMPRFDYLSKCQGWGGKSLDGESNHRSPRAVTGSSGFHTSPWTGSRDSLAGAGHGIPPTHQSDQDQYISRTCHTELAYKPMPRLEWRGTCFGFGFFPKAHAIRHRVSLRALHEPFPLTSNTRNKSLGEEPTHTSSF